MFGGFVNPGTKPHIQIQPVPAPRTSGNDAIVDALANHRDEWFLTTVNVQNNMSSLYGNSPISTLELTLQFDNPQAVRDFYTAVQIAMNGYQNPGYSLGTTTDVMTTEPIIEEEKEEGQYYVKDFGDD